MHLTIECARCSAAHYQPLMICPFCKFGPVLPPAAKRPVAQQVAFLMAIADVVGIIPATIGLLYSLISPVFTLFILPVYALGVWLMINFFRYSKKRMAYDGPVALWGVTLVYNFIGFLIGLYNLTNTHDQEIWRYWAIWMAWLVVWSLAALVSELHAFNVAQADYARAAAQLNQAAQPFAHVQAHRVGEIVPGVVGAHGYVAGAGA